MKTSCIGSKFMIRVRQSRAPRRPSNGRANGAVIFPLAEAMASLGTGTVTVKLAHLGRDAVLGLSVGDWVELVDDSYVQRNGHDALLNVTSIDPEQLMVTLDGISLVSTAQARYAFLRRWDQSRNPG